MGQQEDHNAVERCLQGEAEAYRQLVSRYQGAVAAYLRGKLGRAGDVEEAAQETFVRAYAGLGKLRKRGSFFSWVIGIADRVGREEARRRWRQRRVTAIVDVADPREAAEDGRWGDEALRRAVAGLPGAYRRVVLLRYYAGKSCGEIAEEMGLPVGSVTKMLSRAYAMLREELSERDGEVRS